MLYEIILLYENNYFFFAINDLKIAMLYENFVRS
jgi:hypothetical protein